MPILLDTCVLLWMAADPDRIPKTAREKLQKEEDLYVSAISAFEIAVKHKKNRLQLPISAQAAALAPDIHVPHADPCDRIIIATALLNNLTILSSDHLIRACKQVETSW